LGGYLLRVTLASNLLMVYHSDMVFRTFLRAI
jgi:hypothetical protein